eukprot:PRCOL_00003207-RA
MVAFKELRKQWTPANAHGHISDVPVGVRLNGRGEAAILGLHTAIVSGIMFTTGVPAYAICLSGAYEDDRDDNDDGTIQYTGAGGMEKGKQTKDQENTRGNAALVLSNKCGTPVRVLRGRIVKKNGKDVREYFYDGLYKCTSSRRKALARIGGRKRRATAGATVPVPKMGAKRKRAATRQEMLARYLVCADVSGGAEKVRIPVYNETSDGKGFADLAPSGFCYLKSPTIENASDEALEAIARVPKELPKTAEVAVYNDDDCLVEGCDGIIEIGDMRKVVENGIHSKLEVFRTSNGRGWGVRAGTFLYVGDFVCEYAGYLYTSRQYEDEHGKEELGNSIAANGAPSMRRSYTWNLDHYIKDELNEDDNGFADANELCMDGFNCGSVARWINHSVDGANLLRQCALTPEDPRVPPQSRFCYRICFFAMRDIEPGEEILYDYGPLYQWPDVKGRNGSDVCTGADDEPANGVPAQRPDVDLHLSRRKSTRDTLPDQPGPKPGPTLEEQRWTSAPSDRAAATGPVPVVDLT